MDLESLNRNQLQKLAKEHGIKANQKTTKLIAELQKIVGSQKENIEEKVISDSNKEADDKQVEAANYEDYLTDDTSPVKCNEKPPPLPVNETVTEGFSFGDVSSLSGFMTDDNDNQETSMMVNCTNMTVDEERLKEVSNTTTNSSTLPMKDDTTTAENNDLKTVDSTSVVAPENSDSTVSAPITPAPKTPTQKNPALATPAAPTLAEPETPVLTTPLMTPAPQTTPQMADDFDEKSAAAATTGGNDQTETTPEPHTKCYDDKKSDETFSLPKNKKKRRRAAPPAEVKEVAKVTTYQDWSDKKEASQKNKKVALMRSQEQCRRSPRLKAKREALAAKQTTPLAAIPIKKGVTPKTTTTTPKAEKSAKKLKEANNKTGKTENKKRKNWMEIHSKKFANLESIDDHQKRKQERARKLMTASSAKKQQQQTSATTSRLAKRSNRQILQNEETVSPKKKLKLDTNKTSTINKTSSSSQAQKHFHSASKTSSIPRPNVFRPSVTDVKKIKTNFGRKGSSDQVKFKSKLKFPEKVSTKQSSKVVKKLVQSTPIKSATGKHWSKENLRTPVVPITPKMSTSKSNTSIVKHTTPFKIGGNSYISTPKKDAFDLKKSLQKPLTYQPHTGPLKKFNDTTKIPLKSRTTSASAASNRRLDRNNRRNQAQKNRAQARNDVIMKRRELK